MTGWAVLTILIICGTVLVLALIIHDAVTNENTIKYIHDILKGDRDN